MAPITTATNKRQRQAKERSFHVASRYHAGTTHPTYRRGHIVPAIRLSGQWLRQLGFVHGEKVLIAAEPGRLVLTVAE